MAIVGDLENWHLNQGKITKGLVNIFRSYYEGEFHKGDKHGKGKMVYASGNYYEGEWAND